MSKQDRDNRNFNLNLKVKMWVMQCPHRIAWARAMIGERAIKRWLELYDGTIDQIAEANEASELPEPVRQTTTTKPRAQRSSQPRNYEWKHFALFKITDFVTKPFGECRVRGEHRPSNWLQPREARILKPVEFHPCELVPEAATGIPAPEDEKEEYLDQKQTPEQSGDPPPEKQKDKLADKPP